MIRVYIGSMPAHDVAVKVLTWSILKNTKQEVEFFPLYKHQIDFEMPKDPKNRPGTPFSFQRFMIPEIAEYKGKAIYMDSDQIVFKDVSKLYRNDMKGSGVLCTNPAPWQKGKVLLPSSVMVLDCEKLDWDIKDIVKKLNTGELNYTELFSLAQYPHRLSRRWNSLDRYIKGYTALVHYTAKSKQPWINNIHPLAYLWFGYLYDALDQNYISEDEITEAVDQGYIRPSVSYQVSKRIVDVKKIPEAIKDLDREFIDACAQRRFNSVPGEYRNQPSVKRAVAASH